MKDLHLLLNSRLSQGDEKLTAKQYKAVEMASIDYAWSVLQDYKEKEAKANNRQAIALIPSIIRGETKYWIRNWHFERAKKDAQRMANLVNRWVYVVRKSDVSYEIFSTKQVDHLKRIGIFKKDITAMELQDIADYVAKPQGRLLRTVRVMHSKN